MANKQAMSELNDKVDNIIRLLTEQSDEIKSLNTKLSEQLTKVQTLETEVVTLKTEVATLQRDNRKLKDEVNHSAQLNKANTIRLLGVPSTAEETKSVDGGKTFFTKVYDKFIKPVLTIAAAKGDLPAAPPPPYVCCCHQRL